MHSNLGEDVLGEGAWEGAEVLVFCTLAAFAEKTVADTELFCLSNIFFLSERVIYYLKKKWQKKKRLLPTPPFLAAFPS